VVYRKSGTLPHVVYGWPGMCWEGGIRRACIFALALVRATEVEYNAYRELPSRQPMSPGERRYAVCSYRFKGTFLAEV
jgi:hypothetical protein